MTGMITMTYEIQMTPRTLPPANSIRSMIRIPLFVAGAIAAVCLLGSGCSGTQDADGTNQGYSTGYTMDSLYPEGIYSVSVPIFENKTLFTGIERHITDALIKEIQSRTPYLVHEPGNADTTLNGTITGVEKTKMGQLSGSGLVEDLIVAITIDFEWTDQRSGKMIVSRQRFTAGDAFVPALPVGERPEIGLWAASEELAQDIVSTMQGAW